MTDITAELERLRKENESLRRALRKKENGNAHGKYSRQFDIPEEIKQQLFGVKVLDNEIVPTNEPLIIRTNCQTFISNLVRIILPAPRFNKKGGWISHMNLCDMTDKEFKTCKKFVNDVIKMAYATKAKIEQERIK